MIKNKKNQNQMQDHNIWQGECSSNNKNNSKISQSLNPTLSPFLITNTSLLKKKPEKLSTIKSINYSEKNFDSSKLQQEMQKNPLLKLDMIKDFYPKLSLNNFSLRTKHDQSIVSIDFAFLKNERIHLLIVGLKKGTIILLKKSIENVTDSIYNYDFFKKIFSVKKMIQNQKNVELQKTTVLDEYLICGLTSGVIHLVNLQNGGGGERGEICYSFIAHQGNITTLETFYTGNYLLTSSGSFNRNHDNSICVYHITQLSKKVYVKEKIQIKEAHGSVKGVIVSKALIHKGNELMFSAGGSDDQTLRIWNLLTGQCLFEFVYQEPIYDLNILIFSQNDQMKFSKEDVIPLIDS